MAEMETDGWMDAIIHMYIYIYIYTGCGLGPRGLASAAFKMQASEVS